MKKLSMIFCILILFSNLEITGSDMGKSICSSDGKSKTEVSKIADSSAILPKDPKETTHSTEIKFGTDRGILKDDFLVNDDYSGGRARQRDPSCAIYNDGYSIIVWSDDRNGKNINFDVFFQRVNALGVPQGTNIRVNDNTNTSNQISPSVAVDENEKFVVVWEDNRNGNSDIFFQRYSKFGVATGNNVKVNDDAVMVSQSSPSVGKDEDGNFIIVWQDERNGNLDIFLQRYDASGARVGVNTKVNNDTGSKGQCSPKIAVYPDGKCVIVWIDYRNSSPDVYGQRYSASGEAMGSNFRVNRVSGLIDCLSPSVAVGDGDHFVIVWEDNRNGVFDVFYRINRYFQPHFDDFSDKKANDDAGTIKPRYPSVDMDEDGSFIIAYGKKKNINSDINCRKFNTSGVPQGYSIKINDDVGNAKQQKPVIALSSGRKYCVVWEDFRNGAFNPDIYYVYYNYIALTHNFKANNDQGIAPQSDPSVSINQEGKAVITWEDQRNGQNSIFCQRYDVGGGVLGSNVLVNTGGGSAANPVAGMDGIGNYIVSWEDKRSGNSDIYYQRYDINGLAIGENVKVNDDVGDKVQSNPCVAMDGDGNYIIAWEDNRNITGISDSSSYPRREIYFQRYDASGSLIGVNQKASFDGLTPRFYSPSVAMDGSGNFVIAWKYVWDDDIQWEVDFSHYNASGVVVYGIVTEELWFLYVESPVCAMDMNGNFCIVWTDNRDGNNDVYIRRYNAMGVAQDVSLKVNNDFGIRCVSPFVSIDENGKTYVVWEDYRDELKKPDIVGQRYDANGVSQGSNIRIVADGPNHGEKEPVVAANANKVVFSWTDNRRSLMWDIYAKMTTWDWEGAGTLISP